MLQFELDTRLNMNCYTLGTLQLSVLLLMRNAHFPWFILVPRVSETELFELDKAQQKVLLEEINFLSQFVTEEFKVDKLNIATIGNIVPQLHVHVVGRQKNDVAWPHPVWGISAQKPYSEAQVKTIKHSLTERLSGQYSAFF